MSEAVAPSPQPSPPPEPPPTDDHRARLVLLAGSGTTLLALAGVFAAAHHGENIMGWYANYIIPAGALLVGMVAASGYGAVAWWTGLKMTRKLVWTVVIELAVSYFVAQFGEYQQLFDDASLAGFFDWFDRSTRAFAWQDHSGHAGSPLGALGYGLRALELAGFVGGGALVPAALRAKPYCDPCRTYKRTRVFAVLPAGQIEEDFQAIFAAATAGDRARFDQEVATRGPLARARQARKATHGRLSLARCPRCADGTIVADTVSGRGNNIRVTRVASLPVAPDRVRTLFD